MDELIRALHRKWLAEPSNIAIAQQFLAAYTRQTGEPQETPLNEILVDLLLAHLEDDGVARTTFDATNQLLIILYGKVVASRYRNLTQNVDNRFWMDFEDLDSLVITTALQCNHSEECNKAHPQCEIEMSIDDEAVIGGRALGKCPCPGCFIVGENELTELTSRPTGHLVGLGLSFRELYDDLVDRHLCYHHWGLFKSCDIDFFAEVWDLEPRF